MRAIRYNKAKSYRDNNSHLIVLDTESKRAFLWITLQFVWIWITGIVTCKIPAYQQIFFMKHKQENKQMNKQASGTEKKRGEGSSTWMLITNFPNRRPSSWCPCYPNSSLISQEIRSTFRKKIYRTWKTTTKEKKRCRTNAIHEKENKVLLKTKKQAK